MKNSDDGVKVKVVTIFWQCPSSHLKITQRFGGWICLRVHLERGTAYSGGPVRNTWSQSLNTEQSLDTINKVVTSEFSFIYPSAVPRLTRLVAGLSPRRSRFNRRPVDVRWANWHWSTFLWALRYFPVNIITSMLHTHSLIYCRHDITLGKDGVTEQSTQTYFICIIPRKRLLHCIKRFQSTSPNASLQPCDLTTLGSNAWHPFNRSFYLPPSGISTCVAGP